MVIYNVWDLIKLQLVFWTRPMGDDPFTIELDGLNTGDILVYILFDGNVLPFNESPQFTVISLMESLILQILIWSVDSHPLVDLNSWLIFRRIIPRLL